MVVTYYAALHWMTAAVILFLERRRLPIPKFEDHQTLKSQMQPGKANVDKGCQNVYKLLETKSRDARYEVDPVKAITAQDVIFVNGWAKYIKDWATKHLTADGYTCT